MHLILPEPILVEAEELRRNFYAFVRAAWHVLEPGNPFKDNWHIGVICAHLQAITQRQISRLIINIPFRMTKTSLVSVLWPAWEWASDPTLRYLTASRDAELSTRDALASRRIIQSNWYQERYHHVFSLTGDQNQKTRYENDHRGYRIATSVGAGQTGEGGDRRLIDDPHDMAQIFSDVKRKSVLDWWDNSFSTRFNRSQDDPVVLIMQRGHQRDLTGHLIEQGKWEHVVLPMEFDGIRRRTVLGYYDPRARPDELLDQNRVPQKAVDELRTVLGSYGASSQLQQAPTPPGGGIIQRSWIKLWPRSRPYPPFTYVLQSYDTAFTTTTAADPTAFGAFCLFNYKRKDGSLAPNIMLADCWQNKLAYPDLRRRVKKDYRTRYGGAVAKGHVKHPADPGKKVDAILIERKGSGISLLQDLASLNIPLRGFDPGDADKATRLHAASPLIEQGILWVPESRKFPGQPMTWVLPWLNQLIGFGLEGATTEHDDFVDITTQALLFFRNSGMIDITLRDVQDALEVQEREAEEEIASHQAGANPYAE